MVVVGLAALLLAACGSGDDRELSQLRDEVEELRRDAGTTLPAPEETSSTSTTTTSTTSTTTTSTTIATTTSTAAPTTTTTAPPQPTLPPGPTPQELGMAACSAGYQLENQLLAIDGDISYLRSVIRQIESDAAASGGWFSPSVRNEIESIEAQIAQLQSVAGQYAAQAQSYYGEAASLGVAC